MDMSLALPSCIVSGHADVLFVFMSVLLVVLLFITCFISSLQKVYKSNYEKSRGFSINYCDTPKFQMDSVLKQFTDVRIMS